MRTKNLAEFINCSLTFWGGWFLGEISVRIGILVKLGMENGAKMGLLKVTKTRNEATSRPFSRKNHHL